LLKPVLRAAALTAGICFAVPAVAEPAESHPPAGIRVPAVEAEIMPLDQVRVGMRGYGRSVFAGTAIETFPVIVRSVVSDSSARRGTVWIECVDERMSRSGPVQGMSGSPIYLWDEAEGERGVDGEGGRLIGAFAFGYSSVNVCLVGVQPIEYMREVGRNAVATEDLRRSEADAGEAAGRRTPRVRRVGADTLARGLARMTRLAEDASVPPRETASLRALTRVLGNGDGLVGTTTAHGVGPGADDLAAGPDPQPLGLPVSVGSAEAARWLAPALAPAGLAIRSGGSWGAGATARGVGPLIAGAPPSHVEVAEAVLEPGSVLSIPLAWGDLDLNAAGTVTEVRPDGTVLAFGHAMNAVGDTRLPIATGYTHFVVSRTSISFKQASSLGLVGTLVRDEQAAVAGRPLPNAGENRGVDSATAFDAAPVSVHVELPGQPARDYDFVVVDDPAMTAGVLTAVVINAVSAVQDFPSEHTLRLTGTLTFSGGRVLPLNAEMPGAGARGLAYTILPYVSVMMQNPYEPLKLENAELSVVVSGDIEQLLIESATLDRVTARPGESVSVAVRLERYQQPAVTHTVELALPPDLPEGEYEVVVTDVDGYVDRMMMSRPDLAQVNDIDELYQTVSALVAADGNALYAAIARPDMGVAVDDQPMPALPGSRAAVLANAPTTRVAPYPRFVEADVALDQPVVGGLALPLVVQARR